MVRYFTLLALMTCAAAAHADGLRLELEAGSVELAHSTLRDVKLRCNDLQLGTPLRCADGDFSARVAQLGRVAGNFNANYEDAQHWQAQATLPSRSTDLAAVQKLTQSLGFTLAGELKGRANMTAQASLSADDLRLHAQADSAALDYSEASGRYAAEKLAAKITLDWQRSAQRWQLALVARGGQIYLEPVFMDFAALPLKLDISARQRSDGWLLERVSATQGDAATLSASGRLSHDFKPLLIEATLDAKDLAPVVATDLQPFVIGTRLDGLSASGRATATLTLRDGAPAALSARLQAVTLDASKLGLSLDGLSGNLNWSMRAAVASSLQWQGGTAVAVPFGASQIAFSLRDHDFELLTPWRQPLLDGALQVSRLTLKNLGSNTLSADFGGALEPIQLRALCHALGWPEFSGTLGGNLPGLQLRGDTWALDGALKAQVFGGSVQLERLRAIEPFGVLPRVTADIRLRDLDLERITSVFPLGRITGHIDGDINGLRLLSWSPVAFDSRLYSTPGDDTSRRISQHAIDSISSIGGGPTGLLSRGFLRFFDDFAYDRLGISCVLRDGRCQMDGIAPAASKDGLEGYYLVMGRSLPRIDVVGYAHTVSWNTLIEQIKAAQASSGPQTRAPSSASPPAPP